MKTLLFFVVVSIFICGGCRSTRPVEPVFYLIEYPTDKFMSLSDSLLPLAITIEIAGVKVNPAFSSYQIAVRDNTHRIRYFSQHKWANRPDQSITSFILSFYEKNEVFQNVDTRFWKIDIDYKLITTIHQLEVIEEKKHFFAHLNLEYSLVSAETERVVITHKVVKKQSLAKRDLNLFADAICNILYEELEVFSQMAITRLSGE